MARNLIDGQKAGSGSQRQPVIAPDSASSITKLKEVVGLSEGEIEGFGRDDIKLDGTPLSALSSDIICDYRFGTNNQEYINGVDEVANEIGVGVELSGSTDWVKLITNPDIDHLGIRLRWGPLQTSHTNGDISGVSITYEIHIAVVGGSYERVLATTLSDKTSDSYERYHEFKLPESDNGWMVKVVRVTPSSQSSLVSDKMYVQAYSEIIKSKFTFPHTSLVYLEYDAKTFSNVAKLAVNAKGLIIKVPTNYDPVTRQYSGLWSGTFKMAYSNNPAWIYYDLVTNSRYGCGDRIDQSMVDKWSLYRLAQYCDQMVDDGYGGLEPRFTCNVYLQSKERAYDILNRLTGLFRAINFWNGSQLVVDADIPQDTSYLYTNANVVDGLFEYAGTAATDQYSAAKVAWDNPANGYNTEYEAVSYEHLVKKLGFKVLELDAWGCTSRGQALRAGRWALLAESDTVTFKVGMDGYLAMPGKIIEIQDEFYAGKSNGGRVISVSASKLEVTLDRPVETIAGDTISFNTTTGAVKKYNIVSSAGSVVTLSEEVDASIERMHIWAISSSQLATQKYRILTVKYDGVGEFTISAVEYNASKYKEIDSNILFDEPPTSIINPIAQDAVQNVVIDSYEFVYQGLNTVNLNIKWERAVNAVEYLVEIKKDNGSWLKLPATGNNSIELENIYAGTYIARVTAVSAYELKSLPAYSVKTVVQGKLTAPQAPLNPRVVPVLFGIEFYWDFPENSGDIAVSRIAISYQDPTDLADESSFVTYDKAYSDNKFVLQHLDLHTRVWFKVKLIDKLGFESPYTAWVNGQPSQDVDKVLDLVSGHISESTLDQILKGKIDGALGLAGEANNLASQAKAAASNAQGAANYASIKAQEAANEVVQEAIDRAAAIQAGITQVTTDYIAGDATVLGELVAYKTSNDSAMATVVQKAESAVAVGSTNSQAITELTGQVQAINNTKLDASVITNYYTKGQTEDKSAEIAAGKIESYDANLVIGGVNLIPNSFDILQTTNNGWLWPLYIDVVDGVRRICRIGGNEPSTMSNYTGEFINQPVGTVYTLSVKVRPLGSDYLLGFYGNDNSIKLCKADQWTTIQDTRTVANQPERVSALISYAVQEGVWVEVKEWQAEIGNKATSWSPSPADVQGAIDANANAIQTVTAEVARVNGEVVSTATSVNSLSSNVGLLQGSINEVRQTVTNNQESTNTLVTSLKSGMADADDVSMMMRNATVLFEDLNFRDGDNGVRVYNNYENGALAGNFTDKLPDNPVASTRQLQFIHTGGATTPSLGGFNQIISSRANGVFLIKFVAKLPIGFNFNLAANAYGDGSNGYFIGGSEGTGRFKTYYAVYRCGATGSFTTIGFVYVNGQHPTPENPLIWYLASSTVYDCLDSKVAPDSVVNGIAEAKSTASTAVNKAEATALIAQNIQAALDNTNANISTNYYTSAQIDTVVAGKVEQFSSTIAVGGANLWSVVRAARVSESGSHSVMINREDEEEVWITVNSTINGGSLIRFDSCLVDQNTPFIEGEDVVLSFEVSGSGYNRLGTVYAYVGGYSSAIFNANLVTNPYVWQRVVRKFKVNGTGLSGASQLFGFYLAEAEGWTVGTTLSIRHVQLQRGTTATAFSKAPAIIRATVKETTQTINGIQAIKTVTIDNNGVMSGYGLISELKNGQVTSSFGVNANTFYIGSPYLDKKPFVQRNEWSVINGVWVPPGTYIDTAYIGTATIGNAHISDLAVTTAKIGDGQITAAKIGDAQITTAKIGDLQVDTLKIKDNAVTIPIAITDMTENSQYNVAANVWHTLSWVTLAGISAGQRVLLMFNAMPFNADSANGSVAMTANNNNQISYAFAKLGLRINGTLVATLQHAKTEYVTTVSSTDGYISRWTSPRCAVPTSSTSHFFTAPVDNPLIEIVGMANTVPSLAKQASINYFALVVKK